jgi:hypothetical protein
VGKVVVIQFFQQSHRLVEVVVQVTVLELHKLVVLEVVMQIHQELVQQEIHLLQLLLKVILGEMEVV